MDDGSKPGRPSARRGVINRVVIVGLGPGDLAHTPAATVDLLTAASRVIVRTGDHPACLELLNVRDVETCDDIYDAAETFESVYEQIADRVVTAATSDEVVYAVPGSPLYAERSVSVLRARAERDGIPLEVWPAESFIDASFAKLGVDPAFTGFQVLDGRDLPSPLILHLPTLVFHVDVPIVLGDVLSQLSRTMPDDAAITVLAELATDQASATQYSLDSVPLDVAGYRTTLFIDPEPTGIVGAITAMKTLREECPWDRKQTHESLAPFAIEELYELLDALAHLPAGSPNVDEQDYGAYAEVEEELGDVFLQVLFHATLAEEVGAFDMSDVAETLRRKLVRRHPHVFGDVEVADADEVVTNWQAIKAEEKGERGSLMDGVSPGSPAMMRATKLQERASRVGFDWDSAAAVVGDVEGELAELVEVLDQPEAADELGDVLFAVVNLARHLDVEPDRALRRAVDRFESRFRRIEELGDLEAADATEMHRLWEQAKAEEKLRGSGPRDSGGRSQ
jgi:tetrapyrrole methylase family protein/MazG family protein